jgi:hypothetical protein
MSIPTSQLSGFDQGCRIKAELGYFDRLRGQSLQGSTGQELPEEERSQVTRLAHLNTSAEGHNWLGQFLGHWGREY